MPTLKAARMYMISGLEQACITYLETEIKADQVVAVMSASATLDYNLPREVQEKCWSTILVQSQKVLSAPSFVAAHGSIIARVVKLEEFEVSEEQLWSRLVEWSAHAVEHPELLGPFSNASAEESTAKRLRGDNPPLGANEVALQKGVLQALAKHVRFTVMGKEFFVDKARPYLTREDSESVMMYYLLGRVPPTQVTSKRSGLVPIEQLQLATVTSTGNSAEAEKLSTGRGAWQISNSSTFLEVTLPSKVMVTKLSLTFAAEGTLWVSWKLTNRICGLNVDLPGTLQTDGRMKIMSVSAPLNNFKILPTTSNQYTFAQHAALVNVEVFGKKSREEHAADVVNRLASELLLVASPANPEPCDESAYGQFH
ncbi:unnamed protein product [Polarella glacialis]|uniref:BACK domain-containing protein n=1 Tax=Polarella glacialis TaxID=89957 RepID=A0A813K330_POLGL|nr:unnamed protein product [Polarella glacialis]